MIECWEDFVLYYKSELQKIVFGKRPASHKPCHFLKEESRVSHQENTRPWDVGNAQVDTRGLPSQPLQVCHLEGTAGEQPLVVMMSHPGKEVTYRWQKAAVKSVPGGEALYLWQDCIARPDSVNYLIAGEELHAGDAYRCIQYQGGEPVAVEYHQVRWEDEVKYRPLVQHALYEAGVREEGLRSALSQAEENLSRLTRENEKMKYQLSQLREEHRTLRQMEQARQWAKAWEKRAHAAEEQLASLREQTGGDYTKH